MRTARHTYKRVCLACWLAAEAMVRRSTRQVRYSTSASSAHLADLHKLTASCLVACQHIFRQVCKHAVLCRASTLALAIKGCLVASTHSTRGFMSCSHPPCRSLPKRPWQATSLPDMKHQKQRAQADSMMHASAASMCPRHSGESMHRIASCCCSLTSQHRNPHAHMSMRACMHQHSLH